MSRNLTIDVVSVKNPKSKNLLFGQSHFIKTVEDIHEALVQAVPGIQFGLAFSEASGTRLIRTTGTNDEMIALATENTQAVGCGHIFFIFLDNAYPINIMHAVKHVSEVVTLFAATANPMEVIVGRTKQGGGVLGVIDGGSPLGVEKPKDKDHRHGLLRTFGYKL